MSIRFDDRMRMLLEEMSEKTGLSVSVIVRAMVSGKMEQIMDSDGNLKLEKWSEKTKLR